MRPDISDEIMRSEDELHEPRIRPTERKGGGSTMTSPLHDEFSYQIPRTLPPDDADYRSEQEYLCERCGGELPPNARFCASCGYGLQGSARQSSFGSFETKLGRLFSADAGPARTYGLSPASIIASALGIFCVVFAVVVQSTIPDSSPSYSPAELYQVYSLRTLLWLAGAIAAFLAAIVFKRAHPR